MYSDIAIISVGYRDLVLSNEIKIDNDFKEKEINQIVTFLSFVNNKIDKNKSGRSLEIAHNIEISISALKEIVNYATSKHQYDQMKNDLFTVSSKSIISNIDKYK